jgi:hypothetical protein
MCDKLTKINFFLMLFLISKALSAGFEGLQENPEVRAIQLFNSGKFTEAETIFLQLLEQNPESPISNYYYGASRTENGHFGEKELACLVKAGKNITPERLNYYLGIQHHARGNWEQALKFYNQFRQSIPEPEQKNLELDKKIQLCYNQINPYDGNASGNSAQKFEPDKKAEDPAEPEQTATTSSSDPEDEHIYLSASTDNNIHPETFDNQEQNKSDELYLPREALPNLPGVDPTVPAGDPVEFQVNGIITYHYTSHFQTDIGKELFEKANKLQQQQKNKLEETVELRTAYKNSKSDEERESLAGKILSLENETISMEEEINNLFADSRMAEHEYWENAGHVARNNFIIQQGKIQSGTGEKFSSTPEPEYEILFDMIKPNPKTDTKTSTAELVYKIQIGAYSKAVPAYRQRLYNKLSVIRPIETYTNEKGVVVYTTGNLTRYEDAMKLQNQVKQEGIQDASIVSYFSGKRITLEQAKEMEANNDI